MIFVSIAAVLHTHQQSDAPMTARHVKNYQRSVGSAVLREIMSNENLQLEKGEQVNDEKRQRRRQAKL